MRQKIGFMGLGQMGLPMAENILKKGFPLYVYNRTRQRANSLIEKGVTFVESPKQLAALCDIVVSMVSDDEALRTLSNSLMESDKRPTIHISMSTVSPDLSTDLERRHREKGVHFLAAPVSGRPERAKEGSLWIFLAGEKSAKVQASSVLEAMSCKVFDLGENPFQASLFKLCNNFMILSFIESLSEAFTVLEKGGVSAEMASEVWGNSLFDMMIMKTYGPMLAKRNFEAGGFALDLGLKDIRLLQDCVDKSKAPMPFLTDLHEKLVESMNRGRAKFDWASIALITRERAGLK